MAKDKYASIRQAIIDFRQVRETAKELGERSKEIQPELIMLMQKADPDNDGVVFNPDDSKGTAYVQQNEGSTVWDEEAILDYLSKRKSLWMKSSSRVLDIGKWEALVGSKEIKPAIAKKFQKKLDPAKPFIRFGKRGKESL